MAYTGEDFYETYFVGRGKHFLGNGEQQGNFKMWNHKKHT